MSVCEKGVGGIFALSGLVVGLFFLTSGRAMAGHIDWDGGTNSINTVIGGNANTAANWGPSGGGADGTGGTLPGVGDDVFLNDVVSSAATTRTVTVNANMGWRSLTISQGTAPSTGTNLNVLAFGNFTLSLGSTTPLSLSGGANAYAKLDISGASALNLTNTSAKTVTFGPYSMLIGNPVGSGQGVFNTTAAAATFNLNGVTVLSSANGVNIGGASGSANNNIVNLTAGLGDPGGLLKLVNVSDLNLNWTGALSVVGTIARRDNSTANNITVGSTVTGMSGGSILAQRNTVYPYLRGLYNGSGSLVGTVTSMVFAAGGTGFTLSGGVLDARSATAAYGVITQNLNSITVSGGLLAANSMAANGGSVRVSGGELALANQNGAAVNFTISTTPAATNRTIEMHGGDTGKFSVYNGAANSQIIIPVQSDGGTWDLGTINADKNYYITNGFASTFTTYAVADSCGLNGVRLDGATALPTTLTLGSNSSFFVSFCNAANRTYNIGVGGGNDIKVPSAGGFAFGVNNTNAARSVSMVLNRDKGNDSITLLANGACSTNDLTIAANQTGSGNLFVNARNITIADGVTFAGTGGISVMESLGYGFGTEGVLASGYASMMANEAGGVDRITSVPTTFTLNGSLTGTNTLCLFTTSMISSSFLMGPNASISGLQSISISGGAAIEAATSTSSPSGSSHNKFDRITWSSGNSGATRARLRFINTYQNDGGVPGAKEAVYTASWDESNNQDGSGGHSIIDLNGQDLYVDRFTNMVTFTKKSIILGNTATNATSTIRALVTTGDTLQGGSFLVNNGATLEFVGGNWSDVIYSRNVGDYLADSAAVPNAVNGVNMDQTRRWDGSSASSSGYAAFHHFLGSGQDTAGNASTAYAGTPGTLRIVGGDYVTSGWIISPLGTTGTIETISSNPNYPDATLNQVTIRANSYQAITNVSTSTGVFTAPGHRYMAGAPVYLSGTAPGGMTANVASYYYVVNPSATGFQLSLTPGGAPVIPTTSGSSLSTVDINGQGNNTVYPGYVVAGLSTVKGHLVMPVIGGAAAAGVGANVSAPIFQPTLRVGGVTPVRTAVTVDATLDTVTLASGSVTNGQPIYLTATTAPTGVSIGQVYYARDVSGSQFKLAVLPGEPVIDITSTGTSVSNVTGVATGSAMLVVSGNLSTEARTITGVIGSGALGITLSGVSGNGSLSTVTNSTNLGLAPGDVITATGGGSYNGTYAVSNLLSPTIFTYPSAGSGAAASLLISYSKVASINVAIQSNATVKVGGDVTIGGVGVLQNYLMTGTGVGIDPASQFVLNGGLSATQSVTIVPPVGNFQVGDGTNGVLTGTAANALLVSNLVVAGSLNINGASSITGATANAGITLTNGADLVMNASGSIAIAGTLTAGTNSVVDLSSGTMLAVGALDLSGGGIIDFKTRTDCAGVLRLPGDATAQLNALISAGSIRQASKPLSVVYSAELGYTTVRLSLRGTRLEIY